MEDKMNMYVYCDMRAETETVQPEEARVEYGRMP
jgi:hypothetical protein